MRIRSLLLQVLLSAILSLASPAFGEDRDIKLVAAGSLSEAFNALIADYVKTHPVHIATVWGPSGTLRDALEKGKAFDIFASAALPHAQILSEEAIASPSVLFVRNALCAIVPTASEVAPDTLADFLLKPETRLATSTPNSDPGGDYTWRLFETIDKTHAGAFAALSGKAQQVFGGATTTTPVDGRHRLAVALDGGSADAAIYYCSARRQIAAQTNAKYKVLPLPADLAVEADYGLAISHKASPAAIDFALYILSPRGQQVLKDYGFIPVALPAEN